MFDHSLLDALWHMSSADQIAYFSHIHVQQSFLSALLALAPLISKAVSAMSGSRANARVNEAGLNANEDKLALERAAQEQNNARQNAVTDANLRSSDQSDAVLGGYREGVKDAHFNRPEGVEDTGMTGGARPSAIVGLSQMGHDQKAAALARLLAGNPSLNTKTPELTPVPKPTGFDKFLNIVSGISGAAGLVNNVVTGMKGSNSDSEGDVMPTGSVSFGANPFTKHNALVNTPLPDPNAPWFKPKALKPVTFGGG